MHKHPYLGVLCILAHPGAFLGLLGRGTLGCTVVLLAHKLEEGGGS